MCQEIKLEFGLGLELPELTLEQKVRAEQELERICREGMSFDGMQNMWAGVSVAADPKPTTADEIIAAIEQFRKEVEKPVDINSLLKPVDANAMVRACRADTGILEVIDAQPDGETFRAVVEKHGEALRTELNALWRSYSANPPKSYASLDSPAYIHVSPVTSQIATVDTDTKLNDPRHELGDDLDFNLDHLDLESAEAAAEQSRSGGFDAGSEDEGDCEGCKI